MVKSSLLFEGTRFIQRKDHSWQLCIDYRRLKTVTRMDTYPITRIDDSLDTVSGSILFSMLDLISGYWQVLLDQEAKELSASVTRGGLWQWKVLSFCLTSASATFKKLIEKVLKALQ